MTPEEYWNSEGVRFLNEDGTIPSVESRVKEGFRRGSEEGFWDGVETMKKASESGLPGSPRPDLSQEIAWIHDHVDAPEDRERMMLGAALAEAGRKLRAHHAGGALS